MSEKKRSPQVSDSEDGTKIVITLSAPAEWKGKEVTEISLRRDWYGHDLVRMDEGKDGNRQAMLHFAASLTADKGKPPRYPYAMLAGLPGPDTAAVIIAATTIARGGDDAEGEEEMGKESPATGATS